jgi:type IV pilus assembly protein PilM
LLARAARLETEGKLLEAIECLSEVQENEHSRLASRFNEVHQKKTELTARRERAISERDVVLEAAKRLTQERRYAAAHAELARIPSSLRDQTIRALAAELEPPLAEIKALRAKLAQAVVDGPPNGRLRAVERLAELEPHDEGVIGLLQIERERKRQYDDAVGKKLLAKARAAIASNDYVTAEACLHRMPPIEDPNEVKLLEAVEERVWMMRQLRQAPFANHALLGLAARLAKLQPRDDQAKRICVEISARLKRAENSLIRPFVPWARLKGQTRFGIEIEPVSNLARIHWNGNNSAAAALPGGLRRNLVALGLALKGVGEARFGDLEFEPTESSLLGRLAQPLSRRRVTAAWGLDFGTSGLKFVRLTKRGDVLTLDRAGTIAYGLRQAADETPHVQPMIASAFDQFLSQLSSGDDPLVISFPGTQSLGRFFSLPKMKPRKLDAALEFEVANQIPLPKDEVVYASHCWCPWPDKADTQRIAVAAAKRAHVALRSSAFAERNLRSWTLQSECVALLNVLMHSYAAAIQQLQPDEAIALADIGDSSINLVAVSPARGPWFRTIHRGIRSLNRPLVDELSMTWCQADELRKKLPAVRRASKIDAILEPALDELTRDVECALRAYHDSMEARITRMYVAGGGCDQFGLLRMWSGLVKGAPAESERGG